MPLFGSDKKLFWGAIGCQGSFVSLALSSTKSSFAHEYEPSELLEQLAYIVAGAGHRHGLTATQWAALRFFGRANRFSRTVSSFAEFHATTRGTASETVRRLVDRGFLRKDFSGTDGRSYRLDSTDAGMSALVDDPLSDLLSSLRSLAPGTRTRFVETLRRLLADLAQSRGRPMFGPCHDCAHLDSDQRDAHDGVGCWCNLLAEPLDVADLDELCVNHASAR